MLAAGLRHVVAYQDIAYGATYLDAVEAIARLERGTVPQPPGHAARDSMPVAGALTEVAAKYIARAMAYDDVIRVAGLKTQPSRADRVRHEMGGQIVAVTEFMHPRMEELIGLLTPRLGTALEHRPALVAMLGRMLCGPRRVRTDTVTGFAMLYAVAGLRAWRRRTLRHAQRMGAD